MMKFFNYRSALHLCLIAVSLILFRGSNPPEEGMYPLSEISSLDLKSAGLKIDVKDIYNPGSVSLVDALVRVGGCTGSFVSDEGLILTNHHCAFDYVKQVSTVEKNYIEEGFHAPEKKDELPAEGLTSLITEAYTDVSSSILAAANNAKDLQERTKIIQKKSRELIAEEEKKYPGTKAEVAEMFIGQTYILFRYRELKDVRLVYIPPRTIGEFGGESDNWVWPRHTGDFSFLRAYVAPDGSPAPYSEKNVPYKPKKFLKVNPNGVKEDDFVFILGYPGRTFRHQPASFIDFQEKYQLPYISKVYRWYIDKFEELGTNDPALALQLSARIKTYANTQKNYDGKIAGLRRLGLVNKKREEEKQLNAFINSDPKLKADYATVIDDINAVYKDMDALGRTNFVVGQIRNSVTTIRLGTLLVDYFKEMKKPDAERRSAYTDKNRPVLMDQVKGYFEDLNRNVDALAFERIISEAISFPELKNFGPFQRFMNEDNINSRPKFFAEAMFNGTFIKDYKSFVDLMQDTDNGDKISDDPVIKFVTELNTAYKPFEDKNDAFTGRLNILLPKFIEVKRLWQNKNFVPDANSTLRLTYGYIRGYSPADATYYKPITTLRGMIDKSYLGGDFQISAKLKEAFERGDFGRYFNKELGGVPLAILYNMDTTGGNSGSPVMNANGELIGVNYDRAFEATINDYAWSESYSRSIGADIRFILWVTDKIGGATNVLKELKVL